MRDSEFRRAAVVHADGICIQAFRETIHAGDREPEAIAAAFPADHL